MSFDSAMFTSQIPKMCAKCPKGPFEQHELRYARSSKGSSPKWICLECVERYIKKKKEC